MLNKTNYFYAGLFSLLILFACDTSENKKHDNKAINAFEVSGPTANESFFITASTENKSRFPIGKFHNWTILVTDGKSNPVYPAVITVTGGMPAHGHGLPTKPVVSEYLGDGLYRLGGMKFTMDGNWIIKIHVFTDEIQDSVELNINVSY